MKYLTDYIVSQNVISVKRFSKFFLKIHFYISDHKLYLLDFDTLYSAVVAVLLASDCEICSVFHEPYLASLRLV